MKTLRSATLAILMGIIFLGTASGRAKRDPFLRVDPNHLPEYRRIWSAKLEVTPFDCGRFVVLPAFEPESSVSIHSYLGRDGMTGYRVTYILAAKNMWQASDMIRYPEKARAIRTRRIDADIPGPAAKLLREVWLKLLRGVHPNESTTPRDVIPIDTPYFEWSLQPPNGPPLRVEANFYIETTPLLKLFAHLSDVTLPAYCRAEPAKRPAIARQIEKEATALLRSGRVGSKEE